MRRSEDGHGKFVKALVAAACADDGGGLRTLLELGAHRGALLHTQDRYLGDRLDHAASTAMVERELGGSSRNGQR